MPANARPAVPLALAVLSGAALGGAHPAPALAPLVAVVAALLGALAGRACRPHEKRSRSAAPPLAVGLLLASWGVLGAARALDARAEVRSRAAAVPAADAAVMLKVRVCGRRVLRPGGMLEVPCEVESGVLEDRDPGRGGYRVLVSVPWTLRRRAGDLVPGRRLEVEGRLVHPRAPLLAEAFDRRAGLERDGIAALVAASDVWRLESAATFTPAGLAATLARRVGVAIHAADVEPEAASVLRALLLGEKAAVSADTRRDFAASGVIHVLVTGGLHVALLAALLAGIARALPLPDLARRALAIAGILVYVALVGARPGALRAGLGAVLFLAAGASGRAGDAWNRLALVAIALVLADPACVSDPGFQLSFGTTAGILGLGRLVTLPPPRVPPARRHALLTRARHRLGRDALSAGAAFVAHAPLALVWFGQLAPVGIVANLVAAPLAGATLVPAFAGALLGAIHPLAGRPFLALGAQGARLLLGLAELGASVPLGALELTRPDPIATALGVGLVALGVSLRARAPAPRRGRVLMILGALLWLAAVLPGEPIAANRASVRLRVSPGGRVELLGPRGRVDLSERLADDTDPLADDLRERLADDLSDRSANGRPERLAHGLSDPLADDRAAEPRSRDATGSCVRVLESDGARALRVEASGHAALVVPDLGGRDLARLLESIPEGLLRADVLVAPPRPSRALERLAARSRPLVAIATSPRTGGSVAASLAAAGCAPLELARVGAVEIELGESVSVEPLFPR